MRAVPSPETMIRITPRVFLVADVMYSSPWNITKHWRLPIRREDIDIAQKIAEFLIVNQIRSMKLFYRDKAKCLVIVSGFELFAKKVPCAVQMMGPPRPSRAEAT